VWKLILGYLPADATKWESTMQKHEQNYGEYIQEFVQIKKSQQDHPLSKKQDSQWNHYFKDLELHEEIQKDTQRTRSEMHIFVSEAIDPPNIVSVFRKQKKSILHYEILTRILFVFGKLNPGIKYVQGTAFI
jgi:hypothetical protein